MLFVTIVHPCGNFSDTSSVKFQRTKGSIGPVESLPFQTRPDYILCITARTRPYWLRPVVMRNADRHLVCELHPWAGAVRTPPVGLGCGLTILGRAAWRLDVIFCCFYHTLGHYPGHAEMQPPRVAAQLGPPPPPRILHFFSPFGLRLVNKSFRHFPQFDGLADPRTKINKKNKYFCRPCRPWAH